MCVRNVNFIYEITIFFNSVDLEDYVQRSRRNSAENCSQNGGFCIVVTTLISVSSKRHLKSKVQLCTASVFAHTGNISAQKDSVPLIAFDFQQLDVVYDNNYNITWHFVNNSNSCPSACIQGGSW